MKPAQKLAGGIIVMTMVTIAIALIGIYIQNEGGIMLGSIAKGETQWKNLGEMIKRGFQGRTEKENMMAPEKRTIAEEEKKAMSESEKEIYSYYNKNCTTQGECGENWVCLETKKCGQCTTSEECNGFFSPSYECKEHGFQINSTTIEKLKTCTRKDIFPHFKVWDGLATAGCFIGGSLASSAGIGGGGIYVPILMVTRFPPSMAVALSTCCIFGTAISNFILLIFAKHPKAKKPLINYSAALIFEPIILSGTTIGVLLNVMLPNFVTVIILLLMLVFVTIRTFWKGIKMCRKENKERKAKKKVKSDLTEHLEPGTEDGGEGTPKDETTQEENTDSQLTPVIPSINETQNEDEEDQLKLMKHEKEHKVWRFFESFRLPLWKILAITLAWLVLFTTSLLKGNEAIAGIKKCDPWWWILIAMTFVILFVMSFALGILYWCIWRRKQKIEYPSTPGDIRWNLRNSILLPTLFLSAGLVAGLLGIGGGMIVGPLLLELGVLPEVSMATSAFMIFFTSSATMIQYLLLGTVPTYYAIWFVCFGMASAILGRIVLGFIVKKTGRSSFIIFIIAFSIGAATVLMTGVGIFNIVTDIMNKTNLNFKLPC